MRPVETTQSLIDFIQRSPTPFHAVDTMTKRLNNAGFIQLLESESWDLQPNGRYYTTRNGSSIIAFTLGEGELTDQGFRMIGAHTDSPCLKVKPNPVTVNNSYLQLGVEVYGGALFNPWFDRDLSLAGRVSYRSRDKCIGNTLVNFNKPLATIPSLAIHLDRDANKCRSINAQEHLPPIVIQTSEENPNFAELLMAELKRSQPETNVFEILDYELVFYDTQAPAIIGLHEEFVASARLDNLLSCFAGLQSIIDTSQHYPSLLVCNDHEEVGSGSASGAQGPFLKSILERICGSSEKLAQTISRSMLISADNAHGIHPNYADKHDGKHGPILNRGPVIKTNANQRYASNSETSAIFRDICNKVDVPVQSFVTRSDMACGSTIGPITATEIGVRTLDIGVSQFAMHSIRELAGSQDVYYICIVLTAFLNSESVTIGDG